METILEVRGLSKSLGSFHLQDVSFSLPRGYIMGFIGPNGAGKTTTIKLIMNLINRDGGEVIIFGRDNLRFQKEVKQKIGFVYDENHFYDYLTLEEMKNIVASFYQRWDEALYRRYLKDFGLPGKKKIKDLSRGMKMKYSLALALSHHAELIIMDEPTSGLDPVFRTELLEILQGELQDENRGVLFSSHITSDLERVADYICLINDGRLAFADTYENIREKYLLVKGPRSLLDASSRPLLLGVRENDFGFEALTDKWEQVKETWGNQVIWERPSLDQIILFTARRDKHDAVN